MQTADYLIVGQGLTGTLLAFKLLEKGCKVHVIDPGYEFNSSKVAAGIINPVTGRRVVKSWMFETLFPYAEKTYKQLEEKLGGQYFQKKKIYRILFSPGDENKWLSKTALPEFDNYIEEPDQSPEFMKLVEGAFSAGEIRNGAQVDLDGLTNDFRNFLESKKCLIKANFEHQKLELSEDSASYQNQTYKKIIFCEGHRARFNPWFSYLPFEVAKGEILLIKSYELAQINFEDYLLKHKLFIVPLKGGVFWIGSTYDWEPENDNPSEGKRKELEATLTAILKCEYEIVEHRAGIRPAIKDRRPILGIHPHHPQLAIFNGMGAKGASIAPFWANEMAEHLVNNKEISLEVAISRYAKYLKG